MNTVQICKFCKGNNFFSRNLWKALQLLEMPFFISMLPIAVLELSYI